MQINTLAIVVRKLELLQFREITNYNWHFAFLQFLKTEIKRQSPIFFNKTTLKLHRDKEERLFEHCLQAGNNYCESLIRSMMQ